jgi:hypothetical protein
MSDVVPDGWNVHASGHINWFVPINWHKAGLENKVAYLKYALDFEHNFSNIMVTKTNLCHNGCIIRGKISSNHADYSSVVFKSRITISNNNGVANNNIGNHEGDFEIIYNGLNYRIRTDIGPTDHFEITDQMRETSEKLNSCILKFLPERVVKMAAIAAYLEL